MLDAMRSITVLATACLLGCNAVLGLEDRDRAPTGPGIDAGGDASGVDAIGIDTSGTDAGIDVAMGDVGIDTARADTAPKTWCQSEPPHTYCEDFDQGHGLEFTVTNASLPVVGSPAKTPPGGLTCAIGIKAGPSAVAMPIAVTSSSKGPGIDLDLLVDDIDAAMYGSYDLVQVVMLTTSFRLVLEKEAAMAPRLVVVLVFGSGTTASIGVGGVLPGWNRYSMKINSTTSTPKLEVRVNGSLHGATGAGNLADSGGLFQIQKLVLGASTTAADHMSLIVHYDDVAFDL
jgi:hypothetical protein